MVYYRRRTTRFYRRRRPYVRGRPKRTYRRTTRRFPRRSGPRSLGISGFPRVLYTKLIYAIPNKLFEFTASDTPQTVVIRANGPYDPEYAVGGGQPRFYDSLLGADSGTAPYNMYNVMGCKIEATVQSTNGTAAHMMLGFRPYDVTGPTSVKQAMETRGYKIVSTSAYAGGPASKRIVMYKSIAAIAGKSRKTISEDDTYSADYNTTPSEEILADIIVAPVAVTTSNYYVSIRVTYYMKCYHLNNVDDS